MNFAVGAHFGVAVFGRPFGDLGVEALAILDHRRQQEQVPAPPALRLQPPSHFIARLGLDGALAARAKRRAQPREEQAQEMINLRHRGDGAFAAAARLALLDAHRRGNAGDQIHLRPRQLLDELAGIEVHRIQKAPLPLGEEQVKGQRALARTAHAGDDDEPVARNRQRDIFQIMLARALDGDHLFFHCSWRILSTPPIIAHPPPSASKPGFPRQPFPPHICPYSLSEQNGPPEPFCWRRAGVSAGTARAGICGQSCYL